MRWLDDDEMGDQVPYWNSISDARENAPFLRALARAAMLADGEDYEILRPSLLALSRIEFDRAADRAFAPPASARSRAAAASA